MSSAVSTAARAASTLALGRLELCLAHGDLLGRRLCLGKPGLGLADLGLGHGHGLRIGQHLVGVAARRCLGLVEGLARGEIAFRQGGVALRIGGGALGLGGGGRELGFGLGDAGLGKLDPALSLGQGRRRARPGQIQIGAGLGFAGESRVEIGARACQCGFVVARIDFQDQVAGPDALIVADQQALNRAAHLGTENGRIAVDEGVVGRDQGRG